MTLFCRAAEPVPSPLSEQRLPVLESVPACCGRDCDASWSSGNCCLCVMQDINTHFFRGLTCNGAVNLSLIPRPGIFPHLRQRADWLAAVGS